MWNGLRIVGRVYQHGLAITLLYGFGLLMGLLYLGLILAAVSVVVELTGGSLGNVERLALWLSPLWVPVGLGLAARYVGSDDLKGQDYPESAGRFVKRSKPAAPARVRQR